MSEEGRGVWMCTHGRGAEWDVNEWVFEFNGDVLLEWLLPSLLLLLIKDPC
jgi:hypothetical protein